MNYSKYSKILSFRYEAIIVAMSLLIICTKSSLCDENVRLNFIDDIPVMDSMKIEPELSFGFDSPSGRIIILIATSSDSRRQSRNFIVRLCHNSVGKYLENNIIGEKKNFSSYPLTI